MKPQQLLDEAPSLGQARHSHAHCARTSLPTLVVIAVALASSVMLTLSGCVDSAGIAPVAPANVGLEASANADTTAGAAAGGGARTEGYRRSAAAYPVISR